ncbi:hypothetical protein VNO77_19047 [Canavalia gladiata]|uniref:Uncharacterized protein n=1 Tax=Canavalia gladiata TaxID=3824 RepID=A0AAN9LQU8_CANGL
MICFQRLPAISQSDPSVEESCSGPLRFEKESEMPKEIHAKAMQIRAHVHSQQRATAEDMESSYLKRKEQREVHVEEGGHNKSPCLDKHVLLSPPTSESICTLGTSGHFKVSSPSIENIRGYENPPALSDVANRNRVSKQGSCWSQLRFQE